MSPIVIEVEEELSWAGGGQTSDDKDLYIRLRRNGDVEWNQRRTTNLRSAKIPVEQVAEIVARIDSIDPKKIQSNMGPYNVYVDTGVDLHFHVMTSKWNRRFSVGNPWSGLTLKPIPEQLKTLLCVVVDLRAQVAGEERDSELCGKK